MSMLDARLNDLLSRIDEITNRLAASNCGQSELLSVQEETILLQELQHLNVRLAARFAPRHSVVLSQPTVQKALGTVCAGLVLALMIGFILMIGSVFLHEFAASLASMARPVP